MLQDLPMEAFSYTAELAQTTATGPTHQIMVR